jgi:hypothetical protein
MRPKIAQKNDPILQMKLLLHVILPSSYMLVHYILELRNFPISQTKLDIKVALLHS